MFRPVGTVTNWVDALEEIHSLREEYKKNYSIMTAYERQTVENYIAQRRRLNRDEIARGAVAVFNTAISRYQDTLNRGKAEWQSEVNRWNAALLRDEMQVAEMRVKAVIDRNNLPGDDPTEELRAIYAEGMQSGNIHKARAVAEVMTNVLAKSTGRAGEPGANRLRLNSIAQQARKELAELRNTAGMKEAEQARQDAEYQLINEHTGLDRVAQVLGYRDAMGAHGPLSAAYERLLRDEDGELVIGPEKQRAEWLEEFQERMGNR